MSEIAVLPVVLVLDNAHHVPDVLEAALTHSWVSTYQVGFGPPLVRANATLIERLKTSKATFEKLRAYLDTCILDRDECARLSSLHARLLIRRFGPLEAEDIDRYAGDALDLSLRLHDIHRAPPEIVRDMCDAGLENKWPKDLDFEQLGARFLIRLSDPRNERLLDLPELAPPKKEGQEAEAHGGLSFALELRAPVAAHEIFKAWGERIARDAKVPVRVVALDRLPSRARVSRNGERI